MNESDLEMRQRSNQTFSRIANGFGHHLANRLGWKESSVGPAQAIKVAVEANDWDTVMKIVPQVFSNRPAINAQFPRDAALRPALRM